MSTVTDTTINNFLLETLKVKQLTLQSNISNIIVEFKYVMKCLHYENAYSNIYISDALEIQNISYNGTQNYL